MHITQRPSGGTTPSTTAAGGLLDRLPAAEREAIALARRERLTYRDVAAALGISEETAKRRIRSGLQRMRTEMDRVGAIAS